MRRGPVESRKCVICQKSVSKPTWVWRTSVDRSTCSDICRQRLPEIFPRAHEKRLESVVVSGYRAETQSTHPLANKNGLLLEHRKVLYEKIGPGPHPCNWCGRILEWGGIHGIISDHVDFNKQNNDPSNLVPSCLRCNWSRRE